MKMNLSQLTNPKKRYDFILLFDVTDGNPNGDPDAGNLPRLDPETMQGIVTDVALKRKIRDYVALTREGEKGYDIYVKHRGILTNEQKKAYENKEDDNKQETIKSAKEWMCENFFDTRMFGAVMSTKKFNAGQVRGPVQLTFARSIDEITPFDITITRVALTNATDVKDKGEETDTEARYGQMGRKAYIPYGLYVVYGFYTPAFGKQTGVGESDLQTLWESLVNMWDLDRSASRGRMACRGLYVFAHDSEFGNAPSHELFNLLDVRRNTEVVARKAKDYTVTITEDVPEGVTLHRLVDSLSLKPTRV